MKKIKLLTPILGLSTLAGVITPLSSCGQNNLVKPTGITIDPTEATIKVGQIVKLNATVAPDGASQEVTWTSSDNETATVDNEGNVKGIKEGTVTITANPKGYDIPNTSIITIEPIQPDVTLDDYWSINYHYDGRLSAPYQFNVVDLQKGDEAFIDITSQTVDGTDVQYLSIGQGQEHQIIADDQTTLDFNMVASETYPLKPFEIVVGINIRIERNNQEIVNKQFTLYAEWAKPILRDKLDIHIDETTGKNTLYGFKNVYDPELESGNYTMLYVPEDVEVIDDNAFWDSAPESYIPDSIQWLLLDESWGRSTSNLKEIGANAFRKSNLEDLTIFIPSSVEIIKDNAFSHCCLGNSETMLKFGTSPKSNLKKIGDSAFYYANIKNELILPDGIEEIGEQSFLEEEATKLYIPSSLTKVGSNAFGLGFNGCSVIDMTDWQALPTVGDKGWYEFKIFSDWFGQGEYSAGRKGKIYVSCSDEETWLEFMQKHGINARGPFCEVEMITK